MVRWVVGSIPHGVDPLSYFSFQPVLHDWCIKGRGMCYTVYGIVHIKEPLLLIGKSSPCGGSRFPFSLSEWSLTVCLMPYFLPSFLFSNMVVDQAVIGWRLALIGTHIVIFSRNFLDSKA